MKTVITERTLATAFALIVILMFSSIAVQAQEERIAVTLPSTPLWTCLTSLNVPAGDVMVTFGRGQLDNGGVARNPVWYSMDNRCGAGKTLSIQFSREVKNIQLRVIGDEYRHPVTVNGIPVSGWAPYYSALPNVTVPGPIVKGRFSIVLV